MNLVEASKRIASLDTQVHNLTRRVQSLEADARPIGTVQDDSKAIEVHLSKEFDKQIKKIRARKKARRKKR